MQAPCAPGLTRKSIGWNRLWALRGDAYIDRPSTCFGFKDLGSKPFSVLRLIAAISEPSGIAA